MRGVILDTNFLLIPFTLNIDIFSKMEEVCDFPYKLYIVDRTLLELEELINSDKKGKDKKAAKLALSFVEKFQIGIIKTTENEHVDDLIVAVAEEKGYFVATQDKGLKGKLKEKKIPIIFLRQKSYLVVEK